MREIFESAIEGMLTDLLTPAVHRQCADGGWPGELWNALEEAEFSRALVAEAAGGSGASWDDAYILARAAGAHAVPAPFADAIFANWLLDRTGIDASGGAIAVATQSSLTCTHGRASGVLASVPWGRHLERVVALIQAEQPCIVVLDAQRAREVEHRSNLAGEPRDHLKFENVPVLAIAELPADLSPDVLLVGGAMMRSAQMAGALQSLLRQTATYAGERKQFGKPIGHFQVIQQQIAHLAEHVSCALLAAEAAFAESSPDPAPLPVMAAKICAGEAASIGAAIAHAVHGAIGFTDEHSLHLKTRRLWAWRMEYGSQTFWSQRLGREVCANGSAALWPMLTQSTAPTRAATLE